MIDKYSMNEYSKHRTYLIKNMRDYMNGNMKPEQKQEYEHRNKRAVELSREIDMNYRHPEKGNKFYKLMEK